MRTISVQADRQTFCYFYMMITSQQFFFLFQNILYHAVKDCIAFLESYDEEQTKEPEQPVKTEGGATIVKYYYS